MRVSALTVLLAVAAAITQGPAAGYAIGRCERSNVACVRAIANL